MIAMFGIKIDAGDNPETGRLDHYYIKGTTPGAKV